MNEGLNVPTCKDCGGNCCRLFFFSGVKLDQHEWTSLEADVRRKCRSPEEFARCESLKCLPTTGTIKPRSCAFLLENGLCSIYDKRPNVCRGYPVKIKARSTSITVVVSDDCPDGARLAERFTNDPRGRCGLDPQDMRPVSVRLISSDDEE